LPPAIILGIAIGTGYIDLLPWSLGCNMLWPELYRNACNLCRLDCSSFSTSLFESRGEISPDSISSQLCTTQKCKAQILNPLILLSPKPWIANHDQLWVPRCFVIMGIIQIHHEP
jgi:hypothetical protein